MLEGDMPRSETGPKAAHSMGAALIADVAVVSTVSLTSVSVCPVPSQGRVFLGFSEQLLDSFLGSL